MKPAATILRKSSDASAIGAEKPHRTPQDVLLQTINLSKKFKGFSAVDNVNLRIERGSIHALIGPNGAGKTTVFNLLTKFLAPTSGKIIYDGSDITSEKPVDIARRGIVRSFQISAVFPNLTVLENVRVALQRQQGGSFVFWRSESCLNKLNDRAVALLDEVGMATVADVKTAELPYGSKRALEIATTLALDPVLLMLDEPTQGMGHEDVGKVVRLIRKVAASRTVLLVEHNLSVVKDLSDTITVLQRGSILAEGTYAQVSQNPEVIEAYMGSAPHG
jgi:branched-chain amino acid transport system ATP-binding protein